MAFNSSEKEQEKYNIFDINVNIMMWDGLWSIKGNDLHHSISSKDGLGKQEYYDIKIRLEIIHSEPPS